jgi:hypothetical protein
MYGASNGPTHARTQMLVGWRIMAGSGPPTDPATEPRAEEAAEAEAEADGAVVSPSGFSAGVALALLLALLGSAVVSRLSSSSISWGPPGDAPGPSPPCPAGAPSRFCPSGRHALKRRRVYPPGPPAAPPAEPFSASTADRLALMLSRSCVCVRVGVSAWMSAWVWVRRGGEGGARRWGV